jgi:glucosamine-6-phosphate deaminase
LKDESVWFPDPDNPVAYDERIAVAGGIDFFILASGASDGHVAFNPPGSERDSRTRIVELSETTRRDNLVTFPEFGRLESVPSHGISVGIATITAAKEAAMVLTGEGKAQSYDRILQSKTYNPDWPATVIHACAAGEIVSDADAARHQAKP